MDEKKVREAIERMCKMRDMYNSTLCSLPPKTREKSEYNNYVDTFLAAIEALEKQLPEKVDAKEDFKDFNGNLICYKGFCPSCGYVVDSSKTNYCNACGQKLDWTVEE